MHSSRGMWHTYRTLTRKIYTNDTFEPTCVVLGLHKRPSPRLEQKSIDRPLQSIYHTDWACAFLQHGNLISSSRIASSHPFALLNKAHVQFPAFVYCGKVEISTCVQAPDCCKGVDVQQGMQRRKLLSNLPSEAQEVDIARQVSGNML